MLDLKLSKKKHTKLMFMLSTLSLNKDLIDGRIKNTKIRRFRSLEEKKKPVKDVWITD